MIKKCRISVSPVLVLALCLCLYAGFSRPVIYLILAAASHELGHIAYLLLRRQEVRSIQFRLLGASMETVPLSYGDEMLCAFIGPLINLLCYGIWRGHGIFPLASFGLFLFNMLPIYPLDGGRLLRAALSCFFQEKTVIAAVRAVSFLMSLLLMLGVVSVCVLAQQGIWLMVLCGAVILKLNYDAQQDGY